MSIGANLRRYRQRKGWSQPELSDRSGVRQTTISDIETGKMVNVRIATLEKLAAALGIRVTKLLDTGRRK